MKNVILLSLLLVVFYIAACNGQPNTKTTIEVGIVHPLAGKSYKVFMEVKSDSSTSRLINNMDYLNPNVSDLIVTLQNQHTVGDTLFGEYQINDLTTKRYVKGGLVQVDNVTLKYSAMTVSYWVGLDTIEPKPAGFIFRKKH